MSPRRTRVEARDLMIEEEGGVQLTWCSEEEVRRIYLIRERRLSQRSELKAETVESQRGMVLRVRRRYWGRGQRWDTRELKELPKVLSQIPSFSEVPEFEAGKSTPSKLCAMTLFITL